MRQLKAMPFIRAYSATAGEKLSYLLSECSDDTTVEHIPFLYEKLRKEENMAVLTSDTNKFLGWLNFDVITLISSISANIRSILAGRNERAIEIFALRSKGETLEAVGSLYGVTRERIRQIESKVHKTFWNVYEKQKYDLIMLVYALRNGDNVLHFDELKNTVGDEFAAVLWACIKHNQEHEHYYYSKTLDAIVVKTDDAENMSEAALLSTIDALLTTLPDVMLASEKESTIAELAEKNSIPKEALNSVFDSIYQQSENFLHRGRLKGIGFLYVREGTPILPLLNGGAQENSLRAGTENVASIVGMATALSMNCSQIQKSQNHSAKMVELICSILNDAEVDYIRNGYSNGLKGTLNLSFRGKDGEAILHRLDLRGILVSTGSACDSNSVQVSHVIKAINVPDSYAKGTIRISLGKDNTIEEAKIIGETLVSVLMEQK